MNDYKNKDFSYLDEGSEYFSPARSIESELIGYCLAVLIPVGIVSFFYFLFKSFS